MLHFNTHTTYTEEHTMALNETSNEKSELCQHAETLATLLGDGTPDSWHDVVKIVIDTATRALRKVPHLGNLALLRTAFACVVYGERASLPAGFVDKGVKMPNQRSREFARKLYLLILGYKTFEGRDAFYDMLNVNIAKFLIVSKEEDFDFLTWVYGLGRGYRSEMRMRLLDGLDISELCEFDRYYLARLKMFAEDMIKRGDGSMISVNGQNYMDSGLSTEQFGEICSDEFLRGERTDDTLKKRMAFSRRMLVKKGFITSTGATQSRRYWVLWPWPIPDAVIIADTDVSVSHDGDGRHEPATGESAESTLGPDSDIGFGELVLGNLTVSDIPRIKARMSALQSEMDKITLGGEEIHRLESEILEMEHALREKKERLDSIRERLSDVSLIDRIVMNINILDAVASVISKGKD